METRVCTKCKEEKLLTEYYKNSLSKTGLTTYCKSCDKNRYRHADYVKRLYGINIEEYNEMVMLQCGTCAICSEIPENHRLAVDHNHDTGIVRGLLCRKCNAGIGLLQDNPQLIERALEYVK